jgi:integrase
MWLEHMWLEVWTYSSASFHQLKDKVVIPYTRASTRDTKTNKARQIPTNHVFLYEGHPIKSIKTALKRAKRLAGVEGFRFHDLRHCAATNLRRAGVDTATAMRIVGHKSEKTWKRYNAIDEKDLTRAASKLNTYLEANTLITPASLPGSINSASA